MGRVPCCDEMGMKKGPWTPEEDRILVSYIQKHGHGNWRALPKLAGLSRCGKSCRLRWTNYLRPDVKRGDFSREEEESIIYLHAVLGNRWSAIAAKLPGRTDNEIKNVWHTHLKKRSSPNQAAIADSQRRNRIASINKETGKNSEPEEQVSPVSSQSYALSSVIPIEEDNNNNNNNKEDFVNSLEELLGTEDKLVNGILTPGRGWPEEEEEEVSTGERRPPSNEDDIRFWMNLLAEAGNLECFE